MNEKVFKPRDYLRKLTDKHAEREIGEEEVATYIAREIMPYAERLACSGINSLDHLFDMTISSEFQLKLIGELHKQGFTLRNKLVDPHEFPRQYGIRISW